MNPKKYFMANKFIRKNFYYNEKNGSKLMGWLKVLVLENLTL